MADVKQILKKIEGKLRMLEFTRDDTPRIRKKNELKSLERHEKVFGELIENIHEQKSKCKWRGSKKETTLMKLNNGRSRWKKRLLGSKNLWQSCRPK